MKLSKGKLKTIAAILGAFLILAALAFLLQNILNRYSETIMEFTQSIGIWGPIFLTLGIAFGGVFVPMTSLPFVIIGLSLYTYWEVLAIYYLGNTIIAPIVDFWIARKWGRGVVAKLAGRKALNEIDKFGDIAGYKILILLRITGGVLFDSISYAVGLTKLDFKKVMLITAIAPIPGHLLTIKILQESVQTSPLFMAALLALSYGSAAIASFVLYKNRKVDKLIEKDR